MALGHVTLGVLDSSQAGALAPSISTDGASVPAWIALQLQGTFTQSEYRMPVVGLLGGGGGGRLGGRFVKNRTFW